MGNEASKSKPTSAAPSKVLTSVREAPPFNKKNDDPENRGSILKESQSTDTLQSIMTRASFSAEVVRKPRKSVYDEIYEGPTRFGSFLTGMKTHLTVGIDKTYFGGQAGAIRIYTLVLGVVSIGMSLPGFTKTKKLMVGYGEGYSGILSYFSSAFMCVSLTISVAFIILLLFFKEVRCQVKWDDWNQIANAVAAFFAVVSGILELGSIFATRKANCQVNKNVICKSDQDIVDEPEYYEKQFILEYKAFHYLSSLFKVFTGLLFSASSRMYLKNANLNITSL